MTHASSTLVDWLLQEGGPVVRWLAISQVADRPGEATLRRARADLLAAPHVRLWLDRVEQVNGFHNSSNDCLENVAGKLGEFGLRAGMEPLDSRMRRFIDWAEHRDRLHERGMLAMLNRVIACWGLLRLGYVGSDAMRDFVLARLEQLYRVAQWGRYDIFLSEDPRDMPKQYRGRYRVVAPEFTPDGVSWLPYTHDLYMLANMPRDWADAGVQRKIDAVIQYVLADEYQRLPSGYGYLRDDSRGKASYYVLGWNVHLPGSGDTPPSGHCQSYFVQRLELMSHFAAARKSSWWLKSTKLLQACRTDDGNYLFPAQWLQEKPVGYWIAGARMGLEDPRRSEKSRRLESTLRALRLPGGGVASAGPRCIEKHQSHPPSRSCVATCIQKRFGKHA